MSKQSVYDAALDAILRGRSLTKEQIAALNEDDFYAGLPPMTDEPNQATIDAAQAAKFRAAAAAQRDLYSKG